MRCKLVQGYLQGKAEKPYLAKNIIEEYFERLEIAKDEPERDEYSRQYLERFNTYFSSDIKPLPSDYLNIGRDGEAMALNYPMISCGLQRIWILKR